MNGLTNRLKKYRENKKGRKRGYSGLLKFVFSSTYFSFIAPNNRI